MKKVVIFVAVLLLIVPIRTSLAVEEPSGFMGMRWETSLSEFEEKDLVVGRTIDHYENDLTRIHSKMDSRGMHPIDGIEVSMMRFGFYKNKFMEVLIYDYDHCRNTFSKILFEKYGKPTKINTLKNYFGAEVGEELTWIMPNVEIALYLNHAAKEGHLYYHYLPLFREYNKASSSIPKQLKEKF